jgi:hypothetical protein
MSEQSVPREGLTTQQAALVRMVYGAQTTQVVYVAARLGIADILAGGLRSSSELAAAVSVDEPTLRRLFRGLVGLALCAEVEGGRFALTEMGKYLNSSENLSNSGPALESLFLPLARNTRWC